MKLKDHRLEPRLVRGPAVTHVHNGGLGKDNPGRAHRRVAVETLVTVWVHPDTPDISDVPAKPRMRKLGKSERMIRQLGVADRGEARVVALEIARDQAAAQKEMELELRALGYPWRKVEKMCGGRFPETAAEFLSTYASNELRLAA